MEGGVLWPCRYCGERFFDLSEHYPSCAAKRRAEAAVDLRRLETMEAEARPAFEPRGQRGGNGMGWPRDWPDRANDDEAVRRFLTPPPVEARVKGKGGRPRKHADRRAYMRGYMRARRAKVIS